MSQIDIVRAWKDEDYYNSLTAEQRAQIPTNPAGTIALDDSLLQPSEHNYQDSDSRIEVCRPFSLFC